MTTHSSHYHYLLLLLSFFSPSLREREREVSTVREWKPGKKNDL